MADSSPPPQGGPNYAALRAMGIPIRQSAPVGVGPSREQQKEDAASQANRGSGEKGEEDSETVWDAEKTGDSATPQSGVNYEALRKQGIFLRQSAPPRAGPAPQASRPPPVRLPIFEHLKGKRVILASASPRRKALLAQVGLTNLEIIPSSKPENLSKAEYGPFEYVSATASQKCLDVYQGALAAQEAAAAAGTEVPADPELVIAADTVVVTRAGEVLEKPRSAADHGRMLRHLRDTRMHRVLTAVSVLAPKREASHPGYAVAGHVEETKVFFAGADDGLPDDVVDAYVATREGADKAGGYALQGVGGLLLVERIEGCVDNVVGLPVRKTLQLVEQVCFRQDEEEAGSDEE